jgi:hypothetical protein
MGATRRVHFWLMLLWLGPGVVANLILQDKLPWTAFMSLYAIVVSHATGWGAGRAEDAANKTEGKT